MSIRVVNATNHLTGGSEFVHFKTLDVQKYGSTIGRIQRKTEGQGSDSGPWIAWIGDEQSSKELPSKDAALRHVVRTHNRGAQ